MRTLVGFFRRAFLRHGPRRYAVMQPERADRKYDDFARPMTDAHIQAHLDGRAAYAVGSSEMGAYMSGVPVSAASSSRWPLGSKK